MRKRKVFLRLNVQLLQYKISLINYHRLPFISLYYYYHRNKCKIANDLEV
jgi:hypothetical protein